MIHPVREGTVTTPDGRTLAYLERGAQDGLPVFALHGTPGCRFVRHSDPELYERHGVRWIAYAPVTASPTRTSGGRSRTRRQTSRRSRTGSASTASPWSAAPAARLTRSPAARCSATE